MFYCFTQWAGFTLMILSSSLSRHNLTAHLHHFHPLRKLSVQTADVSVDLSKTVVYSGSLPVCLCVCPSVSQSVSVRLSVRLSFCASVCLCLCLSVCQWCVHSLHVCLMSVCVCLSVCVLVSASLSVCQWSVCQWCVHSLHSLSDVC